MSTEEYSNYRSQSVFDETLTPPKTPTRLDNLKRTHIWPEPETEPEIPVKRRKTATPPPELEFSASHQEVLLLYGPKQKYIHTQQQPIPRLEDEREMLVEIEAVGLNPIDWKAPDFGFGLPSLPCISGRDFAGMIVKKPKAWSRFRAGDRVMAISTDYRDSRKSAYQRYAVVSDFNACRIPAHISAQEAAPLGVAFVAAALGLGICMGVDFARGGGPDLLKAVRSLPREALPEDIRSECFDGISVKERAKTGDWIVIWGGSSATGCIAAQLAKLAGLKVIAVIDLARSGERMLRYGADLLVDRLDTKRAVSVIKGITKGKLRFGLDTIGKDTARLLAGAMESGSPDEGKSKVAAHLVGLTGVPKEAIEGVRYHSVPIKSFHEARAVGEGLTLWLEKLLREGQLATLDIEVAEGGLEGINAALDKLRDGRVNGPRIVVPLK